MSDDRRLEALEHPDDIAVNAFATRMKHKLAVKREQGKEGWRDRDWTPEQISEDLHEHIVKGDPIDVANYCMFLDHRRARITSHGSVAFFRELLDETALRLSLAECLGRRIHRDLMHALDIHVLPEGMRDSQLKTHRERAESLGKAIGDTRDYRHRLHNEITRLEYQLAEERSTEEMLAWIENNARITEKRSNGETYRELRLRPRQPLDGFHSVHDFLQAAKALDDEAQENRKEGPK